MSAPDIAMPGQRSPGERGRVGSRALGRVCYRGGREESDSMDRAGDSLVRKWASMDGKHVPSKVSLHCPHCQDENSHQLHWSDSNGTLMFASVRCPGCQKEIVFILVGFDNAGGLDSGKLYVYPKGHLPTGCTFCGKHHTEVDMLIAGPDVNICGECVGLCADIVAEHRLKAGDSIEESETT
jgi:hypothetical protein